MPRTPSTPTLSIKAGSNSPSNWIKQRKNKNNVMYCVNATDSEYESMIEDEEDKYHHHETPELLQATGSSESLYEDEDSVNDVVSLSGTPVNQEQKHLPSPLFTDQGCDSGSPAPGEFCIYTTGLSILGQAPSARPSPVVHGFTSPSPSYTDEYPTPGPSSDMDQPPITSFPPTADSPTPLSAPSSPLLLPEIILPNGTGSPSFSQTGYDYYAPFPQECPCGCLFSGEMPSGSVINELHPPTPGAVYRTAGLVAPEHTPGSYTQYLPAELDEGVFSFTGMEAAVPEQPIWNPIEDLGYIEQELLQLPAPALPAAAPAFPLPAAAPAFPLPATAPAFPLPATAPVPSFPANVATGQFGQNTGYSDHPRQRNDIPQTFGSDQPPAVFPPVSQQQSAPASAVQNTFNFYSPVSVAVHSGTTSPHSIANPHNIGQGSKPVWIQGWLFQAQ